MKNKRIGSSLEDFLKEEGVLEEAQAIAIKRALSFQIQQAMKQKHLTKKRMTERMHIKSRIQLDRLLDPNNVSVTLLTLEKAANALGKRLTVKLV